ncbi:hypothetical protein DYB37_009090 [Aphanomyces astaci]|uniref:Uncharacterized protein n=1 Tax=Aphanomyces astaci TaxID=112090 RepID=A0A3R7E437_APHAT|nr:hypothetical protein DYB35_008653 [Aphanomyces astaci]RHZ32309.1 hypothetical protein DYB37_009090 [Aphanomyces astaci]
MFIGGGWFIVDKTERSLAASTYCEMADDDAVLDCETGPVTGSDRVAPIVRGFEVVRIDRFHRTDRTPTDATTAAVAAGHVRETDFVLDRGHPSDVSQWNESIP